MLYRRRCPITSALLLTALTLIFPFGSTGNFMLHSMDSLPMTTESSILFPKQDTETESVTITSSLVYPDEGGNEKLNEEEILEMSTSIEEPPTEEGSDTVQTGRRCRGKRRGRRLEKRDSELLCK
ncbi:unnamed protein product [Orchesella dallaii]|uniref:Uncharacterized protein n=1 Tax=Orchesella dallaii TaxID=48710 RepID=A0ABP1S100_9HEXA